MKSSKSRQARTLKYYGVALLLGAICAHYLPSLEGGAIFCSQLILRTLKLISLPMIFFSIVSVIGGMEERSVLQKIGRKTLFYTLLTTLLSSSLALLLFLLIAPSFPSSSSLAPLATESFSLPKEGYLSHLIQLIPANLVELFYESNFVGLLLIAVIVGLALFHLPKRERLALLPLFSSSFQLVLQISRFFVWAMPLFIWAFCFLFFRQLHSPEMAKTSFLHSIGCYLLLIFLSNFLHAAGTLPLLLLLHQISPRKLFTQMFPALQVAFFSSSSNLTLPVTMKCAREEGKFSSHVVHFVFPLCSTINMNACASFILITVLFVSGQAGLNFSSFDLLGWVAISSLAAVANAGVPQGCFFLSTALLTAMGVPLQLMGVILPFYVFIDMAETAVNVWSDSCIASIIDQGVNKTTCELSSS